MTKTTTTNNQPTTELVNVNAALAKQWLTHNRRNRNISAITTGRYRADMVGGRWQFAADPIRFDAEGSLLDGQHRLSALAECPSTVVIPMLVVRGLQTESQLIMDQGKRRTPGDQLSLLGVKDANVVAAGIKLYLALETGLLFRDNHVRQAQATNAHMEEWYSRNTDLVEIVSNYSHLRTSDSPPSVAFCAAIMMTRAYGPTETQEFFRLLAVGAGEGHPINTLDKRLQRIRREGLKMSQRDYLALFIQAANAWRQGRSIARFQKPRGAKWTVESYPALIEDVAA